MIKVDDVKILNIDEVPYEVEKMSKEVQSMVSVFNGWNQRDAEVADELTMVRAAKNDLSRNIILQVRKELQEAAESEKATEATEGGNTESLADTAGEEVVNSIN